MECLLRQKSTKYQKGKRANVKIELGYRSAIKDAESERFRE